MTDDRARTRKEEWAAMPDSCFETLTFGELAVGDRFICLPCPGDNGGHGGFKGVHWIFQKTSAEIAEAAPGLSYGIPHGSAVNEHRGVPSDFPHSMPVLPVK